MRDLTATEEPEALQALAEDDNVADASSADDDDLPRQSRKWWGNINDDSINDIVALEDALSASGADGLQAEKGRKSWTFRRTDNLRPWGRPEDQTYATHDLPCHALDVSMVIPGQAVADPMAAPPSPTTSKQSSESPIFFDARVVAHRDEGWDDMLERALLCWTSAVV